MHGVYVLTAVNQGASAITHFDVAKVHSHNHLLPSATWIFCLENRMT